MKNNGQFYKMDRQGNLVFSRRGELAKEYGKGDSGWESQRVAIGVMAACGILDFVMFYQLFSSFLYDSQAVLMLAILGMLIGFDLGSIYIGIVLKKRRQGIDAGLVVAAAMGVAFLVAFIANIALRIGVKDLVLPDLSSLTTSAFGEVSQADTGSDLALLYALFASALPVVTSLVSFGISFQTANPLKQRMQKLRMEQVKLEDDIVKIEALLMEYDADSDYFARLLLEDEEKYRDTLEFIKEKMLHYCDYVRERLKEHLGDPVANNVLSQDNRGELLKQYNDESAA